MLIRILRNAALGVTAIGVIGCASMASNLQPTGVDRYSENDTVTTQEDRINAQKDQIRELQASLNERDRELASATRSTESGGGTPGASLFPPDPKPGECYARILTHPRYETESERVLKKDASNRIEITPARYEASEELILVKEASTTIETVPAVYKTVEETVLVKPAATKLEQIPARYDVVSERVLDKPAHTVWKKGPPSQFKGNEVVSTGMSDTGEVMCLVEIPASYKEIEKRVLVSKATTREVEIPAEYKSVSRQVVVTPATTRETKIPAEYGSVNVQKLVAPAREQVVDIPAEYETIARTVLVEDARLEWQRVMCEVNLTADNVRMLQSALAERGIYEGPLDGVIGPRTLQAAQSYANSKGLPAGSNFIAAEVVESLGLSI